MDADKGEGRGNMICPLSMNRTQIMDCEQWECNGWIDGECFLNKMTLSLYYIAKNTNEMKEACYEDDV